MTKTVAVPAIDEAVWPDANLIQVEDGKPVDNLFAEKQYRLLTEPLYANWKAPEGRPFRVSANVGIFYKDKAPGLSPDVLFALDVDPPQGSIFDGTNRSYFVWATGKPPDVVIEIVSDRRGGEDTDKMKDYARIGVPFYAIFDPLERLEAGVLRIFGLDQKRYKPMKAGVLKDLGLGLKLWDGAYEEVDEQWLRWIDADGKLVPTGKERADAEAAQAKSERAKRRKETARADAAEKEIERLRKKLLDAGVAPNGSH